MLVAGLLAVALAGLGFFSTTCAAVPVVRFPFNSQVPTVARVAEPYTFQLAGSTFSADGSDSLSYTLTNAPAWLNLDSGSLTLYGTPGQGNDGANTFDIVATDAGGSVSMSCTLVVAENAAPRITGNISAVLATAGSLSGSSSLALAPSTAFAFFFGQNFFSDDPGRILTYYATLSDHTPLPSWLTFDKSSLGFWGVTPGAATSSRTYTIDLTASDVVGFAGAIAQFSIVVSENQLAFSPQESTLNAEAGTLFQYNLLLSELTINNQSIAADQIRSTSAVLPSWLQLNNDTLDLEGTPPTSFRTLDVDITVTDVYGDVATKTIYLIGDTLSLFAGEVGNLTATAGKHFTYTFNESLFSQSGLNISVDIGASGSWLAFDNSTLQLQGTPPASTTGSSQIVNVTIIASSTALGRSEAQDFTIRIAGSSAGTATSSSGTESQTSASSTSTPNSSSGLIGDRTKDGNTNVGVIVGAVIGSLAFLALLFAVAMLLRRHKRDESPRKSSRSPEKMNISRPLAPPGGWQEMSQEQQVDLERAATAPAASLADAPPCLALNIRASSLNMPKTQYRDSAASSVGDAAAAIAADENIPVWGRESRTSHTPHDSYSTATELARRNSRHSNARLSQLQISPSKRDSRPMNDLSRASQQSVGLGINMQGSVLRNSRLQMLRDGQSLSRNSSTSVGTQGTSVLSMRTGDFPEPPRITKRSERAAAAAALTEAEKRRSIRVVSRSDSSKADIRPMAEKRQSFIRNRASSAIISPLFASSRRASNQREGVVDELAKSSPYNPNIRRGRSLATTFSASSSLEPPARNPLRLTSSTRLPSRANSSPTRRGLQPMHDNSDQYTTTTGTTTASPSPTLNLAAELALPRAERSWVLPGEASPTPPPSSSAYALSSREAARRKWAAKLNRDSRGFPISRSPSPIRINLKTTDIGVGKENEREVRARDKVSELVSNDSLSGPMRQRGGAKAWSSWGKKVVETDEADTGTGAESEWEDVVEMDTGRGREETPVSTMSGTAFV